MTAPLRPTQVTPPLQVVTGKGGVGKSTFSAALALAAAKQGHTVLALELGEPGGLSTLLRARPTEHGVPVQAAKNLHVAWYDGEASLAEYIVRFIPFGARLKPFFAHPLYRAFVSAGPGVRELMAIGKVRDELLGLSSGAPRWDLIVVDAGASGHVLQLLGMPAATARTFKSGLAHREATRVSGTLADPAMTTVHVVARPEVMPLEEAAHVIEQLRAAQLPVGRLVVNQCWPVPPVGADEAVARVKARRADAAGRSLVVAAERALTWAALQEEGITSLEHRLAKPALRLPRLSSPSFGVPELEQLAALVSAEVSS